ncbi:IS5 family transposase [Methanobrevibacter curvatus]|uniref:Transposase DDE domain protein n=1 Tax=Methanobrevibacter curvatus TaxID=49547 RepID=A0A166CDW9_9EURY|nr:IS5 family transposase [Methanobrevibacter curvatus]KZX14405.1 transposase DDE domain protein [Methanobrevibacter curvatus]
MYDLNNYFINKQYAKVEELGDRLADIDPLIDWEVFRPIIKSMYDNQSEKGGRPNNDEIVMLKMLVLQTWYGLSDFEVQKQANDRISFLKFLGFPDKVPDQSTIWLFREKMVENEIDDVIWEELQKQLDEKGFEVKNGVIQDAAFITSDPGHQKANAPRGKKAKTRRSKDGEWTKKGEKSFFGYKLHTKVDIDHHFIREIETTVANVHDSQVDLIEKGEIAYKDKGYFGIKSKGYDATMDKATRNHPLTIRQKLRNKRISRKRSPGERPYAVIKNIFHNGHLKVTTRARIAVKNMFSCFSYNLQQLYTIKKQNTTH